ncbi:SSU ribosomal protein S18p, zinc-independent [[Mycoplasma] cavipharyngis]|uniref:30S ribosomal protein S18 n=1 Tax=[Mycoplasma] cavipharyngis TaxID=92757 RepID=UPI003703F79C
MLKKPKRKKKSPKKICLLCKKGQFYIDYKDIELLKRYLKPNNKISGVRTTGNCNSHQRQIANAIKRARIVAFLPFVIE